MRPSWRKCNQDVIALHTPQHVLFDELKQGWSALPAQRQKKKSRNAAHVINFGWSITWIAMSAHRPAP